MTNYIKLAHELSGSIAELEPAIERAIERVTLEAQKELLLRMQLYRKRIWIPTEVSQPEFQELVDGAIPMWFVDRELKILCARLAELDKEVREK